MIFIETKTLSYQLSNARRVDLLTALEEKSIVPAIRSARLKCFETALVGSELVLEMETELATGDDENSEDHVLGDLFFHADHVFFLVFRDNQSPQVRAGIVYESGTVEPFRKLDSFCSNVRQVVAAQAAPNEVPTWQHETVPMPSGFKSFVTKQDSDSLYGSVRRKSTSDRARAAAILEDTNARVFLRHAKEAHAEGYAAKMLAGDVAASNESSITMLTDAGLVEREVQISCRRSGHALFRLPNAHALAVVTVSDATCSECGSPVADEKVEEVIAPTRLAVSLLEDGAWLISRMHQLLRELEVPESEIAIGPSESDGYGQMMANICGESFLLLARDGDLTPAFARWAIDLEIDTQASHLVVVATGRFHRHAEMLLNNHARQRDRSGHDFELIVADDAATATEELRQAFHRVFSRLLDEQLCDLDGLLGLSARRLILTKFKLASRVVEPEVVHSYSEPADERQPLALSAHASAGARGTYSTEEAHLQDLSDTYVDAAYVGNEGPLDSVVSAIDVKPE